MVSMRYHKVRSVTKLEAMLIIRYQKSSLNECVVIEHFGEWFDICAMTDKEVADFVMDLGRKRAAEVAAGRLAPH